MFSPTGSDKANKHICIKKSIINAFASQPNLSPSCLFMAAYLFVHLSLGFRARELSALGNTNEMPI